MAQYVELTIEQGATFNTTITVSDAENNTKNLTGFSARSQLRRSYYSNTAYDFDVVITDAPSGFITMSLTAANTSLLPPGRMVYDVELEDNDTGEVIRIFEGIAVILPNVTR